MPNSTRKKSKSKTKVKQKQKQVQQVIVNIDNSKKTRKASTSTKPPLAPRQQMPMPVNIFYHPPPTQSRVEYNPNVPIWLDAPYRQQANIPERNQLVVPQSLIPIHDKPKILDEINSAKKDLDRGSSPSEMFSTPSSLKMKEEEDKNDLQDLASSKTPLPTPTPKKLFESPRPDPGSELIRRGAPRPGIDINEVREIGKISFASASKSPGVILAGAPAPDGAGRLHVLLNINGERVEKKLKADGKSLRDHISEGRFIQFM